MKNKKERKIEPIAIFTSVFSIIGILFIVFSLTRNKNIDDKIDSENLDYINEVKITEHVYSNEEMQSFAKNVDEQREFEFSDVDLQFGEDYYVLKQILLYGDQEKLNSYREGKKEFWNIKVNYGYGAKIIKTGVQL